MFKLSQEGEAKIKKELARYETKYSAIIPALYVVQAEHGWVSQEAVSFLSQLMEIPPAHINEVLNFYTMFNKKPVGKHHIQVCCNLSCSMAGGRELTDHIEKQLHVKDQEVTPDGKFSVSRVECLGACDKAPMMQVNFEYHENLNLEKVDKLLKELK